MVSFACFRYEYLFNFDNTFEIHDDIEVLKRMGMAFGLEKNHCTTDNLRKAIRMVPKALEPYVLGKEQTLFQIKVLFHYLEELQFTDTLCSKCYGI